MVSLEGGSSKNSCIHGHKKPVVYGSYTITTIYHDHRAVVYVISTTGGAFDVHSNHSTNMICLCLCMIISVSKEWKCIGQRTGTFQICQLSKIDDRLRRKLRLKAAECQKGFEELAKRFTGRRLKRNITRERARQETESARLNIRARQRTPQETRVKGTLDKLILVQHRGNG